MRSAYEPGWEAAEVAMRGNEDDEIFYDVLPLPEDAKTFGQCGPRTREIVLLVCTKPGLTAYELINFMTSGNERSRYAAVARAVRNGFVSRRNGRLFP